MEKYRKNAAMIQVFYEELNYETLSEIVGYTVSWKFLKLDRRKIDLLKLSVSQSFRRSWRCNGTMDWHFRCEYSRSCSAYLVLHRIFPKKAANR